MTLKPFLEDMLSMSTGTDGHTLQIHFSRPVTVDDRLALMDAHNYAVTRPDEPVEGLENVAWRHPAAHWAHKEYDAIVHHCLNDGPKPEPLVTRSQAEAIIVGRDTIIEMQADSIDKLQRKVQHWQDKHATLEADNAALTARVKELEKHVEELQEKNSAETCACSYDAAGDVCKGHSPAVKALETQLAAARKALEFISGIGFVAAKDAPAHHDEAVKVARAALEAKP